MRGKAYADLVFSDATPQIATIRPNVLIPSEPDASRTAEIVKVAAEVVPEDIKVKVVEVKRWQVRR